MEQLTPTERARLERVAGIVFDVQRYSVHDGPGLRTNVFLKGCPLRCGWCANPESQKLQPELALSANHCIECGQFEEPCPVCWGNRIDAKKGEATLFPRSAWEQELGFIGVQSTLWTPDTREREDEFKARTAICPTGAIHWIGERRTAGDVIKEVRRDVPFYEDGGGMTLTGGEPTMQPHLAKALLRLAKAEGISTAMETCGHIQWPVLERLWPFLDNLLFDLKHVDSDTHQIFTGLDNDLILSNLRRLAALNAPLTIRVPLIPGFNASVESVRAIAEFVLALDGPVRNIDLLPYHTLGKAKYTALGKDYPWEGHNPLTKIEVEHLAKVVEACGIKVRIGG